MKRLHHFDVLILWYEEYLTIKGYRPRTAEDYLFEVSFFRRFIEKNTDIDDIDELGKEQIRLFLASMYDKGLLPRSIHHKCSAVINFFKALYVENKLYTDLRPHIKLPRIGKPLPTNILPEKQMRSVFAYLEESTDNIVVQGLYSAIAVRDRAIVETLYSTGMRKGEIIALDLCDIKYDDSLASIRDGKGGKDRIVPIGRTAIGCIQRYVEEARPVFSRSGDALFVNRWGGRGGEYTIAHAVKKTLRDAGIEKKITVHGMRHSCATHMLNNGADIRYVQELLGHKDLSSTQIYTHVSIDKLKKTHQRHHPRERE